MSLEHQKGDLEFAAEYGDGMELLARIQAMAARVNHMVTLDSPERPITYDTRVIFYKLPGCAKALFVHDPYYGMRIKAAYNFLDARWNRK